MKIALRRERFAFERAFGARLVATAIFTKPDLNARSYGSFAVGRCRAGVLEAAEAGVGPVGEVGVEEVASGAGAEETVAPALPTASCLGPKPRAVRLSALMAPSFGSF